MTTVLLQMSAAIWHWLDPAVVQPQHPALQALSASEWQRWGTLQLLVSACIVAPIAEELFFRGLLLQTLWHYSRSIWFSIATSALAFGFVHYAQPQAILPMFTMGIAVGYVRVRLRSLPACIVLHALFNGRTMFIAITAPQLLEP
jgi:membrane protease YdiL (CAAX protease family)